MCDSDCSCVKSNAKPVLEDWAKIKAYREATPSSAMSDEYILTNWRSMASCIGALARRIQRDDTPPVPQDLLIWREAWAKTTERRPKSRTPEDYRKGDMDYFYQMDSAVKTAIHLALEGFGKE